MYRPLHNMTHGVIEEDRFSSLLNTSHPSPQPITNWEYRQLMQYKHIEDPAFDHAPPLNSSPPFMFKGVFDNRSPNIAFEPSDLKMDYLKKEQTAAKMVSSKVRGTKRST